MVLHECEALSDGTIDVAHGSGGKYGTDTGSTNGLQHGTGDTRTNGCVWGVGAAQLGATNGQSRSRPVHRQRAAH